MFTVLPGDGDDAAHVVIVAGDVLEQIAHVHADDTVDKIIVIGDVDPAQDLTEQAVVQLAIGRVGCAGLRLRGVCRESRDSSETECQHQGQYQAQCLAHFFHGNFASFKFQANIHGKGGGKMSDTGVRIPSARSKKPFLTTKYRPQLFKKHLKSD